MRGLDAFRDRSGLTLTGRVHLLLSGVLLARIIAEALGLTAMLFKTVLGSLGLWRGPSCAVDLSVSGLDDLLGRYLRLALNFGVAHLLQVLLLPVVGLLVRA